jgi:hypothetical protein
MLAFARAEMKFETLPPGQAERRIIPMATDGGGFSSITSAKVSAGSSRNCEKIPSRADFGLSKSRLKFETFISRATPNMMQASVMFMYSSPPSLKFRRISSIADKDSNIT